MYTMTTTKAKLQARMSSLSQKTREQLIDIILKKNNTEHKNNEKIMALKREMKDLQIVIESKDVVIEEMSKEIVKLKSIMSFRESDKEW